MHTKYAQQIKDARRIITSKGTVCSWIKTDNTDTTDDPTPEFPVNDSPVQYDNVPIVLYTAQRQNLYTVIPQPLIGQNTNQMCAIIPGDVPFTPANGDRVLIAASGDDYVVESVNTTKPDGTPIVHELFFK